MSTTPQNFFAHRDASTPCKELLEWLTDVPIAVNGTDSTRRQLRAFPRHTYSFDIVLPPNADKTSLTGLRTADEFMVPLWCHAFQRPQLLPDAGVTSNAPQIMQLTPQSTGVLCDASAFAWAEGYYLAAPAALGRLVADGRSISYVTSAMQRSSVSFRLIGFSENVGAYEGALVDGLPSLDVFTQYWTSPGEQIDATGETYDAGHIELSDTLYRKRTFTITLTLTSRADILSFRRLLFALKGRLNAFSWTVPGEAPSTWRLASDGVELSYLRPGLATCQLSVTELTQ